MRKAIVFAAEAIFALAIAAALFSYSPHPPAVGDSAWKAAVAVNDVANAIAMDAASGGEPRLQLALDNAQTLFPNLCLTASAKNEVLRSAKCNKDRPNSVTASKTLYDGDEFYELGVTAQWD